MMAEQKMWEKGGWSYGKKESGVSPVSSRSGRNGIPGKGNNGSKHTRNLGID